MRPILLVGTVAQQPNGEFRVSDGSGSLRVIPEDSAPDGINEVRGLFWDIGRLKADDPRLAGLRSSDDVRHRSRRRVAAPGRRHGRHGLGDYAGAAAAPRFRDRQGRRSLQPSRQSLFDRSSSMPRATSTRRSRSPGSTTGGI